KTELDRRVGLVRTKKIGGPFLSGAPPSNSLCNTLNPAEYQPPGNRKSKLNSAPPPKHNGDTLPPPPMAVSPSTFCSSPVLDRSLLHGGRSSSVFFTRPFLRPVFSNEAPLPRFSVSVRSQKIDELSGHGPAKSHFVENGSSSSVSSSIDFLTFCHRLKTTKRQGWVNHGINGAESIADHMYRMALMSLVVGDPIVGDITPSDGVPKAEKSKLEQAALNEMSEEIKELWYEYENNASVEANLVKDFDKVEMILQALEYETERGKVLDEFFISTAGRVDNLAIT
ncbi:5'-deoxynucleotidase HDDC2, partial [Linum perenne]